MNPEKKEYDIIGQLTEDCQWIEVFHWQQLRRLLSNQLAGVKLAITIKPYREKRSDNQNRYMHGVVVPTVRSWMKNMTGHVYTAEEVYIWLKQEFLDEKPTIREIMGQEVITMNKVTPSKMTTAEFAEFTEKILMGMAERDCHIPEPTKNNDLHDFLPNATKK